MSGRPEVFDYEVISTKRATINGYLNDALTELHSMIKIQKKDKK